MDCGGGFGIIGRGHRLVEIQGDVELLVVERPPCGVGQDRPGVNDELEGAVCTEKAVPVRVEDTGEPVVLFFHGIEVVGVGVELEDGVPVHVAVGALLSGEEDVGDGKDLVDAVKVGVVLAGAVGEIPAAHEIARQEELLGHAQGALRFGAGAAGVAAAFHSFVVVVIRIRGSQKPSFWKEESFSS